MCIHFEPSLDVLRLRPDIITSTKIRSLLGRHVREQRQDVVRSRDWMSILRRKDCIEARPETRHPH